MGLAVQSLQLDALQTKLGKVLMADLSRACFPCAIQLVRSLDECTLQIVEEQ